MEDKNLKKALRTASYSIVGSAFLALIKFFAGIFGNSFALIADAIESTSDVFSSMLVYFGLKYAAKPADENHPYGHGRIEPLVTFAVVGFLIISATYIATESIHQIIKPHSSPKAFTLWILGAIILYKELFYQYVMRKAKETNSSSLKADAWHHRSDAISSLMAFVGISISVFMGKGYETADDWTALIASFFIIYNAYLIFRPALGDIMDEHQYPEIAAWIAEEAQKVPGIINTEKCYVRKMGTHYIVDLHARVNGNISVVEGHQISHDLQNHLKNSEMNIKSVHIHIEPFK